MTLIVGIEHEGSVHMGADSGGWFGDGFEDSNLTPKIFTLPPLVVGAAGTLRSSQLVRYACEELPQDDGDDPLAYLVTQFVPRVRKALNEGGSMGGRDGGGDDSLAEFLVGHKGGLYNVSDRMCVFRTSRGYAVAGHPIARAVALGVLWCTEAMEPQLRIQLALEAAMDHTDCARGPFSFYPTE